MKIYIKINQIVCYILKSAVLFVNAFKPHFYKEMLSLKWVN